MKLSVVIPCCNEKNTLKAVIEKVRLVPIDTEIIVVDDFSTDGTRKLLKNGLETIVDKVFNTRKIWGREPP